MSFVVDASLTLSWFFEDERKPGCDAVLDRLVASSALVPPLWRLEVANGLQMAIRRRRIDAGFRDRALKQLAALPIGVDLDGDDYVWTTTLHLADRFGLTLYDAAYLELAQRPQMPLASLDKHLRAAGDALELVLWGGSRVHRAHTIFEIPATIH